MESAGQIVGGIVAGLAILMVLIVVWRSVYIVREKEVIIVERFGVFDSVRRTGPNFIFYPIYKPKSYSTRFIVSDPYGNQVVHQKTTYRISTQNEVIDYPKQQVISRDNAILYLDAILSYTVINPKQMVYSVQNLPSVLGSLLQAQLRAVAGSLDVDQIIEESQSLHVITAMLDAEANRWGVKVQFVKVQKVEAPGLQEVLAKKKNADLENKQIIIRAKAKKQTDMIDAEGYRDSIIKQAEGKMQEVLARARGEAQATINFANAEARSIKEIARAVPGEDPTKYLLASKYIAVLEGIASSRGTTLHMLPKETAFAQTLAQLGDVKLNNAAIRN